MTPVVPVAPLMSATTAVASSPAVIVIGVPLMIQRAAGGAQGVVSDCEPVSIAAASGDKVAPLPMILAAAAAPTTGLAEKFD